MAATFVPPPPEDADFLEFSTQQEEDFNYAGESSASHTHLKKKPPAAHMQQPMFGGEGFFKSNGQPHFNLQRVPETPALQSALRRQYAAHTPQTEDCRLNFSFDTPSVPGGRSHIGLRSVTEIPEQFRDVFKYSHFNYVQSRVFDDVMYTDSPLVTSAPTGSGKTVIFELAIIRLLMQQAGEQLASTKIIYVAPIKALCSERFEDWQQKFGPLGLRCCELTGDSQLDDYFVLQNAQIVMTTPEKWDSMTRKWRDNKSLVQLVKLFMIDEVHQLNDESRGPTMEAIVSRMKTIQSSLMWENKGESVATGRRRNGLRLIAVSATIPNIADVAAWLGSGEECPALQYSIDEIHRPVRLRRVVLGYPDANSEFKFDLSLNYRLSGVIQCYSDQKPTLVFCATRKGTQQAANTLVKDARFVMNSQHKQRLLSSANAMRDNKLRELVVYGVGYHHAGMDVADRKAIETMFTAGDLPVLFATSTLAMGVNLPAHLVVIKSTMHYIAGGFQECSESQILQMIGRAGRPQFDTSATAVIMTRNSTKAKYEALVSGKQLIESNLHSNLIEHLNAEIVLNTITDVSIALEWLRSTFFYIRVKQNPQHYGMPEQHEQMEEKLQQLCLSNLNLLESNSLIKMDDGFTLQPRETGRLMARYYVAFESMKRMLNLKGTESLADLMIELSQCREFEEVRLRVSEKKVLNTLNKDKNRSTIRFPMNGKIKTTDMKVNCLIQATLGCLPVQEFALNQDAQKILRGASRLSKCLMELQMTEDNFSSLLNATLLHKCLQSRLWENSKHVAKQLDKIGLMLSTTLVNAGLTTFIKILETNPRELELIMNRHPPFGSQIHDAVTKLPQYALSVEQSTGLSADSCELIVTVLLSNQALLKELGGGVSHTSILLIGDTNNKVLCKQRISDSQLMSSGRFIRRLTVHRANTGDELNVHFISLNKVGLDVKQVYSPRYLTPAMTGKRPVPLATGKDNKTITKPVERVKPASAGVRQEYRKSCNHRCVNKAVCGHECCKSGVLVKVTPSSKKTPLPSQQSTSLGSNNQRGRNSMGGYLNELHARANSLPATPVALKRVKPRLSVYSTKQTLNDRFSYQPPPSMKPPPAHNDTNYSSDDDFLPVHNSSVMTGSTSSNYTPRASSSHDLYTNDGRSHCNDIGGSMVPSDFEDFEDEVDTFQEEFFNDYSGSNLVSDSRLSPFNATTVPQFSLPHRDKRVVQHGRVTTSTAKIREPYHHTRVTHVTDSNRQALSAIPKSTGVFPQQSSVCQPHVQQYTSASSRIRARSSYMCDGGVDDGDTDELEAQLSSKKRHVDEIYEDILCDRSSSQTPAKKTRMQSSHKQMKCSDDWREKSVEHRSSLAETLPQKLPTVSASTPLASNPKLNTPSSILTFKDATMFRPPPPPTCSVIMTPVTDPCCFFTAGHTSPEDESENFGSVFAGIF